MGDDATADGDPDIGFRPLENTDLPLLHRWLNEPGVVRWWEGDDVSWDGVVDTYGQPRDDGTEHHLALVGGAPVGWIQCYAVEDSPEEAEAWWAAGASPSAAGIDYLLGEPATRGRGLGPAVIRAFVEQVVFGRHPGWTQVCAAPVAANVASWRALEKAGFRCLAELPEGDGPSRLMVRDR